MDGQLDPREEWIRERIQCLTGQPLSGRLVLFFDTTNFMSIDRDHVVDLEGELFLIRCNEHELRFGLSDQPKFWVKRALAVETGRPHILKLVIREEFRARIGTLEFRCRRSEEKEGRVLEFVRGDQRFMQGRTARDSRGNLVRILDFIRGPTVMDELYAIDLPHEEYFYRQLPRIMSRTLDSLRAIQLLHEGGLCHGDIRNDHILVDEATGRYRWIDFDLEQDSLAYDVASVGNVLHVVVARQLTTFRRVIQQWPSLADRLAAADGSAFFPHRVMNLRKVYPYLPDRLNQVLMRFSLGSRVVYDSVGQVIEDLEECAGDLAWSVEPIEPSR